MLKVCCHQLLLLFLWLSASSERSGNVNFNSGVPPLPPAIVITEIMVDPTPAVGLPNYEWIELKNISASPVNLENFYLGDADGLSAPFPAIVLKPDSFLVVCGVAAGNALASFGKVLALKEFPSLNNAGELLYLLGADKKLLHALRYADTWYQDAGKRVGGWSLEMIDPTNACSGMSNWKASADPRGGSPGKENSVNGNNPDTKAPRLVRAFASTPTSVTLVFDQGLDSASAASHTSYSINDGLASTTASPVFPLFDQVQLQLSAPLVAGKIYTITAKGLFDCAGNGLAGANTARLGLAAPVDTATLVLNEILFNPQPNGSDFIELYNRGKTIIDLQQVSLASRNSGGVVINISPVLGEPFLLLPGDFVVLTENANAVKANYVTPNPDAFIEMNLPPLNDDKGSILLLDQQGRILEELSYSAKWHFSFLNKTEGVSLERLSYTAPTQDATNWHSAATSVGYATPAYKNSQAGAEGAVQGTVSVSPEIVSPDGDGRDDQAIIQYQFPEPGYVANITVFNARGNVVRNFVKNGVCGTSGSFPWDGMGEKSQRLPTGVYIVLTEVFNTKGQTKQFKLPVVVARLGL